MSTPPVPPRPYSTYSSPPPPPPPLPPLPPNFNGGNGPHLDDPLAAPRPHRVDPSVPANMARNLDEQLYNQQQHPHPGSPAPSAINYNPGFIMPSAHPPNIQRGPSPLPPPAGAGWSPWVTPAPTFGSPAPPPFSSPQPTLEHSMQSMYISPRPPSAVPPQPHRTASTMSASASQSSLTAPIPTIPALLSAMTAVQNPSHDPSLKVAWCRDVLYLVDKATNPSSSGDTPAGPADIRDPQLLKLANVAVPMILTLTQPPSPPPVISEATYWKATLTSSGAFPTFVQQNPRNAFRDYEGAARGGYPAAWFKLGRDYEAFGDVQHAKDCFERGVKANIGSCLYRMGMAHLLGQLGLPSSPQTAMPLLSKAASQSTIQNPQPAYVYALILLNEFTALQTPIPQHLLPPQPLLVAKQFLEKSAYLHFSPAQYKLGHAYEFATPPWGFDPLLSVEWYSRASQGGEREADMALSKWFLCGAEGAFDKDESLALIFAEKAANKDLPSAQFAMGYYSEVGIGGNGKGDVVKAVMWYEKAANAGNGDAADRLQALKSSNPQALSRQEHDAIAENKLVRSRTRAKERSDKQGGNTGPPGTQPPRGRADGNQLVEVIRKNTLTSMPEHGGPAQRPPREPSVGPYPQQQQPQQFANANRYTLTDPGASGPVRTASPARAGTGMSGRPGMGARTASEPERPPAASKPPGPQTFAEMGFTGAKAEDKECVIM